MTQEHFDRLTAIDASFLAQEGATSHMHIGALTVLEGPPPAFGDFLDIIRGRLHLVPRYRQRLSFPPIETGRPVWVDDPNFNLEYHVRQTALPRPGVPSPAWTSCTPDEMWAPLAGSADRCARVRGSKACACARSSTRARPVSAGSRVTTSSPSPHRTS